MPATPPLERRFLDHFAASNFSIRALFAAPASTSAPSPENSTPSSPSPFTDAATAALLDSPSLQRRLVSLVNLSNIGLTLAATENRLFARQELRALARATIFRATHLAPTRNTPIEPSPPPRPPAPEPQVPSASQPPETPNTSPATSAHPPGRATLPPCHSATSSSSSSPPPLHFDTPPPDCATPSSYISPADIALILTQAIARPDEPHSGAGIASLAAYLDAGATIDGEPIPADIETLTRCANPALTEFADTTNPLPWHAHSATLPPCHSATSRLFSTLRRATRVAPDCVAPLPFDSRPTPRQFLYMPPLHQTVAAARVSVTLQPSDPLAGDPEPDACSILFTVTRRENPLFPHPFLLTSITTEPNSS